MIALAPGAALLCLAVAWPSDGVAQRFDNFGDADTLSDGFDFSTLPDGDAPPPGRDGGARPDAPGGSGDDASVPAPPPGVGAPVASVSRPATETATRAILRALDKTLGRPTDMDMAVGETAPFGRIAIELLDCRYPADDPSSDAFARLRVSDLGGSSLFEGWMVASSPALSALEHPRYDVWVLRCADA